MRWVVIEDQLPEWYVAVDDVESQVALALTRSCQLGHPHPPATVALDAIAGTWSMAWWYHLEGFEKDQRVLVFMVEMCGGPVSPVVVAWIANVRIAETGVEIIERELWRSCSVPVDCLSAATVAIRSAAHSLIETVGHIDFAWLKSGKFD